MKKIILISFYFLLLVLLGLGIFYTNNLIKQNSLKDKQILKLKRNIKNNFIDLNNTNLDTLNIINSFGYIPFNDKKNYTLKLVDDFYNFTSFSTQVLTHDKSESWPEYGTSFLEFYDNKLYLVSASGIFSFLKYNSDIKNSDILKFKIVDSNIYELIDYPELIYSKSSWGIKDILIKDEKIYISHSKKQSECNRVEILVAKINDNFLNFERFFDQPDCLKASYGYQSGGTLVDYDENNILVGLGDYQNFEDFRKNEKFLYGKIFLINTFSKDIKVLSKGHRNPSGIWYLKEKNIVINTEHGPQGGDEININKLGGKTIPDYGWPISSYGEHYGYSEFDPDSRAYQIAPLHKSHKKFGYIEPLKYFVPSIGISKIIRISDSNEFLIGSMGNDVDEGDMSLHKVIFDDNYNEILGYDFKPINERVRDMIYIEEKNTIVIFGSSNRSIIFVQKNN